MSANPTISVDIRVKAKIDELKQAIALFKEGKLSAEDLQTKAGDLNSTVSAQASAYRALTSAQRVQNFELIQAMRAFRSATSLFRDMNQVYQTLLLGQIATTQETVAQRRAFKELTEGGQNAIDMLDVLGPANTDVKQTFDTLLDSFDELSSEKQEKLIKFYEDYAKNAKLSGDEQQYFNDKLKDLKDINKETITKEDQKKLEDFFGLFTNVGTLATSLGTFVTNLKRLQSLKVPTVGGVPGTGGSSTTGGGPTGGFSGGGPAGIGGLSWLALPFQILAMLGITPNKNQGQDSFTNRFEKLIKSLEEGNKAYGDTGKTEINVTFKDATITSDFDAYDWAQKIAKAYNIEQSKKVP